MRLYWTSGETAESIVGLWSGTQADARAHRKQFKSDGLSFVETAEVDVPTNKDSLLEFLNKNNVQIKDE